MTESATESAAASAAGTLKPGTWLLLGSLYITQFMGIGFFLIALVAILREQGAPLEQLSLIYLLGLVWVIKVLWAPWVDRIRFGALGHYRGWLLLMQSGMVLTLLVIGRFDAVTEFSTVFALSLLFTVLSATQDIAADGLACRLLATEQRGLGNGVQIAGGMVGNLIGGGLVLMLYPVLGWSGCMVLLALGIAIPWLQLVRFREPNLAGRDGEAVVTATLYAHFQRFWQVWRQPGGGRWLLLLMLYPIGISLAYALVTPLLVDVGWPLAWIGFVQNVVGSLLGMAAAAVTGWLIRRFGRRPLLLATALAQAVGILPLVAVALGHSDGLTAAVALGLLLMTYSPVAVVLATLMMDRTRHAHAGTDFTVQFSLYQFVGMAAGAGGLALAGMIGYPGAILAAVLAALLAYCGSFLLYTEHPVALPASALKPLGATVHSD